MWRIEPAGTEGSLSIIPIHNSGAVFMFRNSKASGCTGKPLPLSAALTFLLVAFPTGQAAAQGVGAGNVIEITAEIVGVDKKNRTLTLKGEEGNVVEIEAPEDARNFDQIKVGDNLNLAYMETVEIILAAPGTEAAVEGGAAEDRAEEGEMPGGIRAEALQVTANITAIDRKSRELTLALEDGSEVKKTVDPSVAAFDQLTVGDTIAVRVSRLLAIDVERPGK